MGHLCRRHRPLTHTRPTPTLLPQPPSYGCGRRHQASGTRAGTAGARCCTVEAQEPGSREVGVQDPGSDPGSREVEEQDPGSRKVEELGPGSRIQGGGSAGSRVQGGGRAGSRDGVRCRLLKESSKMISASRGGRGVGDPPVLTTIQDPHHTPVSLVVHFTSSPPL